MSSASPPQAHPGVPVMNSMNTGIPIGAGKQAMIDYLMKHVDQDDLLAAALFVLCDRGHQGADAEERAALSVFSSPLLAQQGMQQSNAAPAMNTLQKTPLQSALPVDMQDNGAMGFNVIADKAAIKKSFLDKSQGSTQHRDIVANSAPQSQKPAGFALADLIEPPAANTMQVPAGFTAALPVIPVQPQLAMPVPMQSQATASIPAQMFDAPFMCGTSDGNQIYDFQMCAQPFGMYGMHPTGVYFDAS